MFFVGTSKTLGLENDPVMILVGAAIIGVSAGMISIPGLPDMLETIETSGLNYDPILVNNTISGMFVTCTATGEFTGPVASSSLTAAYDFRESCDIFACLVLGIALLYFCLCGNFRIFSLTQRERDDRSSMSPETTVDQHVELAEV